MAEDDFSRLVRDLGVVPKGTNVFLRKAVEVTARHVKDAWKDRLKGSPHVPGGPASITYDVKSERDGLSAEIGPQLGRGQASIVGILEVGSASHVSPRGYGIAALQDNEADFEHGIQTAIDDALKVAGL